MLAHKREYDCPIVVTLTYHNVTSIVSLQECVIYLSIPQTLSFFVTLPQQIEPFPTLNNNSTNVTVGIEGHLLELCVVLCPEVMLQGPHLKL